MLDRQHGHSFPPRLLSGAPDPAEAPLCRIPLSGLSARPAILAGAVVSANHHLRANMDKIGVPAPAGGRTAHLRLPLPGGRVPASPGLSPDSANTVFVLTDVGGAMRRDSRPRKNVRQTWSAMLRQAVHEWSAACEITPRAAAR